MNKSFLIPVTLLCLFYFHKGQSQCLVNDKTDFKDTKMSLFEATDFGLQLFQNLFPYKEIRNFLICPYSVWNILALAYLGSAGNTEEELKKVLKIDSKVTVLKKWTALEYVYKIRQLNSADGLKFKVSTKAFLDKTLPLTDCMDHILQKELALIQNIDFSMTNESAAIMNNYISSSTNDKISDMVSESDLEGAAMVFISAAYFNDIWKKTFKQSRTKEDIFYVSIQNISFVPMMRQRGYFRHGMSEEIGAHVLELPYATKEISMFILLPPFIAGEEGFNSMIEKMSAANLKRAIEDIWMGEIDVLLPKFRIDVSFGDNLMEALRQLGIRDLFNESTSNLTNFVGDGQLSIQKMLHKAFIKVSEEGTEAAGAGVAIARARSSRPLTREAFECNHPFAFVIYDKLLDNILFLGAYKAPTKIMTIQ